MAVARANVDAFVVNAMKSGVPFAYETVFSYWKELGDGKVEAKIDRIHERQTIG